MNPVPSMWNIGYGRARSSGLDRVSCPKGPQPKQLAGPGTLWLTRAITAGLLFSLPSSAAAEPAGKIAAELESAACGPRAVFLLLQARGISATYDDVRSAIPLPSDGASIIELQKCLQSYGVACSIRRLDPSDLLNCQTPMIAYLSHTYTGNRAGHFMYIRSVTPEGVDAIDPIVGWRIPHWGWQSFSDAWSGVCLVPDERRSFAQDPLFLVSMLNLVLLGIVLCGVTKSSHANPLVRRRSSLTAGLIGGLFVLGLRGALAAESTADDEILRSPARGGVNAAALLIGCITGESGDLFERVEGMADAPMSIEAVRSLLHRHDCQTVLRHLTFADLARSMPSIALLRYGENRAGSYCVILTAGENEVIVLRAGPIVVDVMPTDEFRRRWTGHALIVSPRNSMKRLRTTAFLSMTAIGLIVGVAVVRRRRSKL